MNNKKLEQGPTSKTELCKETDNDFKPLTIFIKCSIVDVGHCSSVFIVDSDIPYLSFSTKKEVQKNFAKFTRKQPYRASLFQ